MEIVDTLGMATPQRDFTNIRIIIQGSMANKRSELNRFVIKLVRDAQLVVESPSNISVIDRELFYYSLYLGEKGASWLPQLNPNRLVDDDYKKVLEVFTMP